MRIKLRLLKKKMALQTLSALLVCSGLSLGLDIASASESKEDVNECVEAVYQVAMTLGKADPNFEGTTTRQKLEEFSRGSMIFFFDGDDTGTVKGNKNKHRFLGREQHKNRDEWPPENYPYLPKELWEMPLTELLLPHNEIQVLPTEIGQLVNLTVLDLSFNNLRTLPPEIDRLSRLQKFICHGGQLRALPDTFFNLTALEILVLSRHKFVQYTSQDPDGAKVESLMQLAGMHNLKMICLHQNHLKSFLDSFCNAFSDRETSVTLTLGDEDGGRYFDHNNIKVTNIAKYPGVHLARPDEEESCSIQ